MLNDKEFAELVWNWFLPRAKAHNVYSWMEIPPKFRKHLDECGIDLAASELPDLGTVSQFADTESPNDELPAVVVEDWVCRCGDYGSYWRVNRRAYFTLGIPGPYKISDIVREILGEAVGEV